MQVHQSHGDLEVTEFYMYTIYAFLMLLLQCLGMLPFEFLPLKRVQLSSELILSILFLKNQKKDLRIFIYHWKQNFFAIRILDIAEELYSSMLVQFVFS